MARMTAAGPIAAARPAGSVAGPDGLDPRLRERLRALLCCLFLVLIATATRPGRIVPDTKIDMALNPVGFLGRALRLWDVEQFGQLQNQAAGYLFPMGPFYALGHLTGVPAWITQRLWFGALLCAAFLGARRLALRLGIGTEAGRLAAGLAYALGPHALASLGTNSSEYLPPALLPWMVIPLVAAAQGTSGRVRAAARSGLAVACCGGINGTATVAVLAVPVLYVLTRPRGTARVRLLAWWCAAVALATAWWSVPLVLLGRYAFSWLLYTEKADTTTATTGVADVLRGGERWVDYLVVDGRPWWPLGHTFATGTLPVLVTGVVAALGIAGLLRSRLPERTFLLLTLLAGVAVTAAGHAGPLAPAVRELLDGPLAPFRNLYKFDGLVRLPLALGIAHLLVPGRRPWRAGAVAAALAGLAVPAFTIGLSPDGDFTAVPGYWRDATSWLNARAGEQGVIAVPGARFGEYTWGRPMDELTQPLLRARWAERQLVPAGSAGFTRLMDAVDQRIASGHGSTGLAPVLARMGVRYILVRNDLRRDDLRGAWPSRVHEALAASPGIRRAAWFGDVPSGTSVPGDAVGAIDQPYPPVEVYEVANAGGVVGMADADRALRLYGSPEALLTMADDGLLGDRPVLVNGDGTGGKPVVADSLRRVERDFGEIRGNTSPTMTANQDRGVPGSRRDIAEPGWDRYATVASYTGVKDVTASSSASDAEAPFQDPGGIPYAAIDGSTWTRWVSGGRHGPVGQWLRVDFDRSLTPANVTAMFARDAGLGSPPTRVAVETEGGRAVQDLARTSAAQPLRVPAGRTRWLRIRVLGVADGPAAAARVAVTELHVDGVRAVRHYRLPPSPPGASVVVSRTPGGLPGCMRGSERWVCSGGLARGGEEPYGFDRVFPSASSGPARLSGTAALTDPDLIERYTSTDPRLTVRASSADTREPAGLPRSAFDDDPTTTWVPADGDRAPWLALSWRRKVTVGHLTVRRPPGASGPLTARVEGDGGRWREAVLGADGRLSFKPMRVTGLTLRFSGAIPQVTDVIVPGVTAFRSPPSARVPLPCGYGPRLRLNGRLVPTRATGTFGDLLAGRAIRFRACRKITVRPGDNALAPAPFDAFRIDSAVIAPTGSAGGHAHAPAASATVTRWSAEERRVTVDAPQASYLVVNENLNPGWRARIGGRTLRPVRLDGWRQAWVVPAGTKGTVRLSYGPGRVYRAAVLGGLALLPLLLLTAAWPVPFRPGTRRRAPSPAPAGAPPDGGPVPGDGRAGARSLAWVVVAVPVVAALGFWAGGVVGAGVGAFAAAVFALVRRARSPWSAAFMLAATASLAVGTHLDSGRFFAVETLPRLLCMVVLARLVVALFGGSPEPQQRPFQDVVRDGGDGEGQQGDHRELREEAAGEGDVAGQVVPADRDRDLPEEHSVRDAPEEPHDAAAEDRDGAAERDGGDEEGGDQPVQQDPQL